MRAIAKLKEPQALQNYRAQPGATYDGHNFTPIKDCIRDALLAEQGHLCAYCMKRITRENMKIEHWHCRAYFPCEQLDYRNLLGCCKGNESQPPSAQHCDTKKADRNITFNPANQRHHVRLKIRYAGDGTISSEDTQFNDDISKILNLNHTRLKENRQSVWEAVTQILSQNPGSRSKSEIQKQIKRWQQTDSGGAYQEYADVAIYYLQKKLAATT